MPLITACLGDKLDERPGIINGVRLHGRAESFNVHIIVRVGPKDPLMHTCLEIVAPRIVTGRWGGH